MSELPLRLNEVAAKLRRSPESVRRAILRGDIPGYRVDDGGWVFLLGRRCYERMRAFLASTAVGRDVR